MEYCCFSLVLYYITSVVYHLFCLSLVLFITSSVVYHFQWNSVAHQLNSVAAFNFVIPNIEVKNCPKMTFWWKNCSDYNNIFVSILPRQKELAVNYGCSFFTILVEIFINCHARHQPRVDCKMWLENLAKLKSYYMQVKRHYCYYYWLWIFNRFVKGQK